MTFQQALDDAGFTQNQFRKLVEDLTGKNIDQSTTSLWTNEKVATSSLALNLATALLILASHVTPAQMRAIVDEKANGS